MYVSNVCMYACMHACMYVCTKKCAGHVYMILASKFTYECVSLYIYIYMWVNIVEFIDVYNIATYQCIYFLGMCHVYNIPYK